MEMATDFPSTFSEESCIKMVGYDLTANAANRLYAKTGLKAADMDVIELHDCFSANELVIYFNFLLKLNNNFDYFPNKLYMYSQTCVQRPSMEQK